MRHRARSIKGVMVNNKRSFTNLSCRYCDEGSHETQVHIEMCGGCKGSGLVRMGVVGDVLEKNDRQVSCYGCVRVCWPDTAE